jgi:hypothetical protein
MVAPDDEARPGPEPSEIEADVPEADAIEQQQPTLPDDDEDEEPVSIPSDAPEADALEQARGVPMDDDAER